MSPAPDPGPDFERRLAAVRTRLGTLAHQRLDGLTAPDPQTGERWDAAQVWAHLDELIPYWIAQAEKVLAGQAGDPVPFGRTASNPARGDAIEQNRQRGITALWHDVREDLNDLRAFLAGVPDRGWQARGMHPTRGVMTVEQIVEVTLLGHIEEHVAQLEALRVS